MNVSLDRPPIVVGVDGSPQARTAVLWAAREAARRQLPLHVVSAWMWPVYQVPPMPGTGLGAGPDARADTEAMVEAEALAARQLAPTVVVESRVVPGAARTVLTDESRHADLLVVGSRGHGGFTGLLLGSVSRHVAAHAACPVAVVRGQGTASGPVVVGVDDSPPSRRALAMGFEEAAARGASLIALHSLEPPALDRFQRVTWEDYLAASQQAGHAALDEALHPWIEKFPTIPVERRLSEQAAGTALVEASRGAQLVVVGTSGGGVVRRFVLGSVAHVVVEHAECPVIVCRETYAS